MVRSRSHRGPWSPGPASARSSSRAPWPVCGVFDLHHEQVRRGPGTRAWAPTLASTLLDAAALAYEEQLEWLLDLCAVELSVRRLAGEIARTTKQVNGLENIVLPRLHEEARRIVLTLDEREREEHARLRRARTRRTSRDASCDRPDGTWRAARTAYGVAAGVLPAPALSGPRGPRDGAPDGAGPRAVDRSPTGGPGRRRRSRSSRARGLRRGPRTVATGETRAGADGRTHAGSYGAVRPLSQAQFWAGRVQ